MGKKGVWNCEKVKRRFPAAFIEIQVNSRATGNCVVTVEEMLA